MANDKRVDKQHTAPPPKQQQANIVASAQVHKGPIPSPDILAAYNQIRPDFAERIVCMAEETMRHHQEMERSALEGDKEYATRLLRAETRGQWLAFAVSIVVPAIGAYIALNGQPAAGATIGITGVAGTVSALIIGRARKDDHPEKK